MASPADRNPFDAFDGEDAELAPITTGDFLSEMPSAQPAPLAEPSSVTVPKTLHEENANPFDAFDEEPKVEKGPLAEELDSNGFFDNAKALFTGQQKVPTEVRGTGPFGMPVPEAASAPVDKKLGVMGDSWGMMTPEEQAAWTAKRQSKLEDFATGQDQVAGALRDEAASPAATNENDPLFSQFQKDLDKARLADAARFEAGAQKSREELKAIREGRIEPATKTAVRSGVENLVRGVGADVAAATVETVGIGAGYLKRGLIDSSADPADNALYQIGQSIRTYVEERFPGDERRQDEMAQMLARGAGQVASLYGPAVALKAVGAGEKLMVATSAATGAGMEGSALFNEATAAMDAEKARLENESGPRPDLGPSEQDRFVNFMGGIGLGMTEAIPLATEFSGGMTGWRRVASKAVEQGLEETVQEGGQTLGENVLAKTTYDPDRPVLEGVGTGMAVGGLLGMFGGGGGEALTEMMRWKEARLAKATKTDAGASATPQAEKPAETEATPPAATATPTETVSPGVSAAEPPAELSAIADQLAKAAEGADEEMIGPELAKLAASQRNRKAKTPEAAAKAATAAADAAVRAAQGKAAPAAAPSLDDIGAMIRAATPGQKAKAAKVATKAGALGKSMAEIAAEQAGGQSAVDRVSGRGGRPTGETSGETAVADQSAQSTDKSAPAEPAQKRIEIEQEISKLRSKAKVAAWADRNGYEVSDEEMDLPTGELKKLVLERLAPAATVAENANVAAPVSEVPATETAPIATEPAETVATTLRSKRGKVETDYVMSGTSESVMEPDPYAQFKRMADALPQTANDSFQVHGVTNNPDQSLIDLLDNGIDPERAINSGPPAGNAEGGGTLSTRNTAPYLLISDPGKSLQETGVKNVVLNGPSATLKADLKAAYPNVNFMTTEEAKAFMESAPDPKAETSQKPAKPPKRGTLGKRLSDITAEQSGGQAAVDRVAGVQRATQIVTPGGEMEVSANEEIVDLADLKPATGKLQPRDRSRAESQQAIRERANALDPEQLRVSRVSDTGAPIVSADGTVISGNGRVASIRAAYEQNSERAKAYRDSLGEAAKGMKMPVRISRIASSLSEDDLVRLADLSNRSRMEAMSATERAVRDARSAGSDIMALYQGGDFTASPNREFLRQFMDGAVAANERQAISKDGELTKEGQDRLNAAVLASAYDDVTMLSTMLESTDDNIRSITSAMRDAAGRFAQLKADIAKGVVRSDMDVTPYLTEAARIVADLRRRKVRLENWFAQADAFTKPPAEVEFFIRLFYDTSLTRAISREKLADALIAIAEEARRHQDGGLFQDETTALDVLAVGGRRVSAEADQPSLFGSAGDAGAVRGEGSRVAERPGDATAGQGAEAGADLRSRFYDLLEGKAKRSDWAKELGVSEAELKPLVEEALESGWLRKQNNAVFRVAKAKRPGRPETAATVVEPEAAHDTTPAPEVSAEPAAKVRIEDAGEKIGGARKDRWAQRGLSVDDLADMTGGEQSKFVTKDAVWPKPDYAALVEGGMPAETAALVKIVRDRLAAGPRVDTPQGRRDYVEVMGWLRAGLETVKTQQDIKRVRDEVIYDKIGYPRNGGMLQRPTKEQAAKLFSVVKGRREQLQADYRDVRKASQMLADGFPKAAEPWTKKFEVRTASDGGFEVRRKGSYNVLERHATVEASSQAAKAIYDAERAKTKDDEKKTPDRPHLDSVTRTGADVRAGRDVNGDDFIKDFGFRGVEFGNWVASDERQKVANLAYDGLQDLALTLKIPAKAISLNGSLGLAFGARGSGKAMAHYESGKLVINMTKMSGAGSLAHEWAHALDHYFGELDQANAYQGKARGATGWYERAKDYSGKPVSRYDREKGSVEEMRLPNLRPEMSAAFDNVMQRIFKRKLDKAEAVRELELRLERAQSNRDAYKRQIERYDAMSAEDKKRNKSWGESQKSGLEANARFIEQTQKDLAAARGPEFQPKGEVDSSYYRQAVKLSGKAGSDGYWARPTELFARSFESYVFDQIVLAGTRSEYLVQGVEPTRYESELYKGNPYPTGLERESINSAFDRLFDVMESKETETGGVALYAVGSSKPKQKPAPVSPELKARAKYRADIAQGNTVNVPPRTAKAILAAVKPHLDIFPKGIEVGALRFVDPAPEGKAVGTFEMTNGSFREVVLDRDTFESIRAFRDPVTGHVFIVRFGSLAGHDLETIFGELRHEHTHVLRSSQVGPTGNLWSRLVSHAKSLDLLDMDVGTYLQMVGSDTGRNAKPETLLDRYTSLYAKRSDFAEIMDQEHVAHFRELVYHNQLLPEQIAPVQDILDILDSGVFGRAAETLETDDPVYALAQQATDLSKLGYYSMALRAAQALKQAKGTPEQMLAQLKTAGVKDSEIKATGLDRFLSGQKSITKDEIVSHLAAHAVEVMEVTKLNARGMAAERGRDYDRLTPNERDLYDTAQSAKWTNYALDGSNPSYRESVLHLPTKDEDMYRRMNAMPREASVEQFIVNNPRQDFRSGHWSEPNVISHIRSSLQKDEAGRSVFLIDELQSDWGQKVRDGGVRDEEKIAGLKTRMLTIEAEAKPLLERADRVVNAYLDGEPDTNPSRLHWARATNQYGARSIQDMPVEYVGKFLERVQLDEAGPLSKELLDNAEEYKLTQAELRTAEAATPAHPLVSTTDQWVGTSLRRILMQAVEAGAEAVSFTPGAVQNQRYSLSNQVDRINVDYLSGLRTVEVISSKGGTLTVMTVDPKGVVYSADGMDQAVGKPLVEVLGKDVSAKIMAATGRTSLSGLDLELGGDGMRATYDNIYPKTLAKILAKFDKSIKPDNRKLNSAAGKPLSDKSGKVIDFITFPLTEEAKARIAEGLPLFALGGSRPPLDMSPEARKERAEQLGFDTSVVVYHGTTAAFETFGFDSEGKNTLAKSAVPAVFATTSPKLASDYASGWGQDVREGAQVMPMYVNTKNVDVWDLGGGRLKQDVLDKALREAKAAGRDGVIFQRALDTIREVAPGGVASRNAPTIVAAINPAIFRSVNANFDPALDGENNLLYAIGAPVEPRVPKPLLEIMGDLKDTTGTTTTQQLYGLSVMVRDARNRLRQVLRLKPNSRGMAAEVTGQYDRAGGVTRMRSSGDIATLTHEAAHHLETTFGDALAGLMGTHRAELEPLASPGGDALSEGFAEWFSAYVRDPSTARIEAPTFYDAFEEFLDAENSAMLEGLQQVQVDYAEYLNADPVGRGTADIQTSAPPGVIERTARAMGGVTQTLDLVGRTASNWFLDKAHPVRTVVKALLRLADANGVRDANGRRITLRAWENAYKIARMIPGGYKSGHMMIIKGVPDYGTFDVAGPSLQDAVAFAMGSRRKEDWSRQNLDRFGLYLKARRAMAEYDRYTAKIQGLKTLANTSEQASAMRSAATEAASRMAAQIETRQRKLVANRARVRLLDQELKLSERRLSELANVAQMLEGLPSDRLTRVAGLRSETASYITRYRQERATLTQDIDTTETELAARQDRLDMLQSSLDGLNQVIEANRAEKTRLEKQGPMRPPTREPRAYYAKIKADLDQQFPQYAEAAKMVAEWQRRLLKFERDAGRWSEEAYQALLERSDWYVPFMRKMDDLDTGGTAPLKGKSNIQKFKAAKRFKGSDRDIINPIESMMERAYHTGIAAMFNDMVGALANQAERVGPGGRQILERVSRSETVSGTPDVFEQLRQQAIALGMDEFEATMLIQRFEQDFSDTDLSLVWSPDRVGPGKVLTVPLWENGERNAVRLNDKAYAQDLFDAMQGLSHQQLNLVTRIMGAPARMLSRGVVSHPAFVIPNIVRDALASSFVTGAPPLWTQAKGIYYELGESTAGSALLRSLGVTPPKIASTYQAAGGIMGGQMTATMSALKDKVAVEEMRRRGFHFANWKQGLNPLSEHNWAQVASEMSETATRLGVFAHALKRAKRLDPTMSDFDAVREAAFTARDVMDFDRRGSKMLSLTHIIAFLNPALQGVSVATRTLRGQSDRGSAFAELAKVYWRNERGETLSANDRAALVTATKMMAFASVYAVLVLIAHLLQEDDDEYREIQETTSSRDLPVKIGGQWIRIPKPFEFALPANMLIAGVDYARGKDPRLYSRWADQFKENVTPPAAPQIMTLVGGFMYNTDAFGNDIVNMGEQRLPGVMQFNNYTSQLAIEMALAADRVGVEMSPEMIDFTLTTAGGYWGKDIKLLSDQIAGKESESLTDKFLIGPLTSRLSINPARSSAGRSEFWTLMGQAGGSYTAAAAGYKKVMESGAGALMSPERYLSRLAPEEQAYAILKTQFEGDGKTQRYHPLERAKKVMEHYRDVSKEIILNGAVTDGSIKPAKGEDPETFPIGPAHGSELRDILGRLQMMEAANALIAIGHDQWSVRKPFDTSLVWDELRASSPEVADELERRIEKDAVEDYAVVAKAWPSLRDMLIKDATGLTKADLKSELQTTP